MKKESKIDEEMRYKAQQLQLKGENSSKDQFPLFWVYFSRKGQESP